MRNDNTSHAFFSMSGVKHWMAAILSVRSSSTSVSSGGTNTWSLMRPYKEKSQWVMSGGEEDIDKEQGPGVLCNQSTCAAICHLKTHLQLSGKGLLYLVVQYPAVEWNHHLVYLFMFALYIKITYDIRYSISREKNQSIIFTNNYFECLPSGVKIHGLISL